MVWMKTGEGLEITKGTKAFYQECPECGLDHVVRVEWKEDSIVLAREIYGGIKDKP